MKRRIFIDELRNHSDILWDIIVIGGGATGLGVALDGASRGFKTLLLEQADFSMGTSSRSTKLVHGGVRYLAQGDLLMVMEALHERGLMLQNAPFIAGDQEFIIPIYTPWNAVVYTAGLKFYDLLAGSLSLGPSRFISREKTLARLPLLNPERLIGGVVYHDGLFDDSRMALTLAHACAERGGVLMNYFKVNTLLKDRQGKIAGVGAQDMISGELFELKSNLVINATGVFSDEIARLDDPLAKPTIQPSRGVHIVLDRSFLQSNSAILIPKTADGRVLFAIPWHDVVVVGTTDRPLDKVTLEPFATESEVGFILQTAGKYLVKPPRRQDILSVFAGLRPLAADPGNPLSTKAISRRHKISVSPSGLLSVIGGKWTTYRRMAEEAIDKAIRIGLLEKRPCITSTLKLVNIPAGKSANRLCIYGQGFIEIEKMISEDPALGLPIDVRFPYTRAEIIWICRNEMPVRLDDVLSRRTRALILNARASADLAPVVAAIMCEESGYDSAWQQEQITLYNKLVTNYI